MCFVQVELLEEVRQSNGASVAVDGNWQRRGKSGSCRQAPIPPSKPFGDSPVQLKQIFVHCRETAAQDSGKPSVREPRVCACLVSHPDDPMSIRATSPQKHWSPTCNHHSGRGTLMWPGIVDRSLRLGRKFNSSLINQHPTRLGLSASLFALSSSIRHRAILQPLAPPPWDQGIVTSYCWKLRPLGINPLPVVVRYPPGVAAKTRRLRVLIGLCPSRLHLVNCVSTGGCQTLSTRGTTT